jgi:hypothetical protein
LVSTDSYRQPTLDKKNIIASPITIGLEAISRFGEIAMTKN